MGDAVAHRAAIAAPDAQTVGDLAGLVPAELSLAGQIDALVAWERTRSWVDAQQAQMLAAIAANPARPISPHGPHALAELDKHWIREDVAAALRVGNGEARGRMHDAQSLVDQFPATLAALIEGSVTLRHARLLIEHTTQLDPATAAKVENAALPKAMQQTSTQFRQTVKRAVLTADPRDAEQKHTAERDERRVSIQPQPHGMASLWAYGPAEDIATIDTAIRAVADKMKQADHRDDVCRDSAQRAFDALTALGVHTLTGCRASGDTSDANVGGGVGTWQGRKPSVQVTVALSTLLGLDGQPAELTGHGPVTAATAVRMAVDPSAEWRMLTTDDAGKLLDFGRSTYEPPQALRDYLIAAHPSCYNPICNRQSRHTELDHVLSWAEGGRTSARNMRPGCTRHHHSRHEAGWTVTVNEDDGSIRWTSPTGHRYENPPDQLLIDRTAELIEPKPPDEDPPPF